MMEIQEKYNKLKSIISEYGKVAVAFSGGVDSTLLSKVSYDVLKENAIAITLFSPMNSKSEMKDAEELAIAIGIQHYFIYDEVIELEVAENPVNRCYHCKKTEFSKIMKKAEEQKISIVFDGSNMDDLSDYRPGLQALTELKIVSPLREAGLTKNDIRQISKELGLRTWNKPAFACLGSRIPYGEKITPEKLTKIEKAEEYLSSIGFIQYRVRSHHDIARIEVSPNERHKLFNEELLDDISKKIKSFGYLFVCLELEGYSTGSLNREIVKS